MLLKIHQSVIEIRVGRGHHISVMIVSISELYSLSIFFKDLGSST